MRLVKPAVGHAVNPVVSVYGFDYVLYPSLPSCTSERPCGHNRMARSGEVS
jgi:hypothetical protein